MLFVFRDWWLQFYAWSDRFVALISESGHWADFIDPCSGYPVHSDHGSTVYAEVEGMQLLLKYKTSVCVIISCLFIEYGGSNSFECQHTK
jgi:hypothetical protein